MNVEMKIKDWKIEADKEIKVPKVIGSYELLMNGKSIADQSFNEGYSSKEIPFSGDLVQKLVAIEKDITEEINKMLT